MTTAAGFGSLPDLVEQASGPRSLRLVLQRADLPAGILTDPSQRFPLGAMVQLFSEAGRVTGDRLLGWRVGEQMPIEDYGMWVRYALAAPTLRLALRRLSWSLPLHQSGPKLGLRKGREGLVLFYRLPDLGPAPSAQHADHVVPSLLAFICRYLSPAWRPAWIGLPYPQDADAAQLRRAVALPLRFDCDAIMIPIVPGDLDHRQRHEVVEVPTQSDVLARLRRNQNVTSVFEDCIRLEMLAGQIGRDAVARRMALSVRSMQRILSVEGSSFQDILEKVRREKAMEMLSDGSLQIADIATRLGYADPSNFSKAFKRWTGQVPTSLRNGAQSEPDA